MEEIVYEDYLNHYISKNIAMCEEIESLVKELKSIENYSYECWSGKSFSVYESKIEEIVLSTSKVEDDLDAMLNLLNAIRKEYLVALGI